MGTRWWLGWLAGCVGLALVAVGIILAFNSYLLLVTV